MPNLDVRGHTFGWDNESPPRAFEVGPFRAEWRCVTNGEFEKYWREMKGKEGAVDMPTSWVEEDGEVKVGFVFTFLKSIELYLITSSTSQVRTMYGLVPMQIAEHWPVLTSYDDLTTFAKSKGGRLPSEPELRLFHDMYDVGHEGGANIGFRHWHPVP